VVVAIVDVQVNSQNAVRSLNQVNVASKVAEAGVNNLKGAVIGLTAGLTALSAIKLVIGKTAELEKQTRSFETLTGSVDEAKRIISDLQQLGAITPFTSSELIDAARRLQAFGVEAKNVVETTRRLADVSGATGAELQGLVTAYGQVQAKGRLQGEELLQFQERGIALQEELRRMYGMTGKEFQDALSKGRISAEAVEVAIINLTDKGGKYANGAIAQSTTLEGKFSTLTDGIEGIARKIGEALKPALKEILDLAISVVNKINEALAGPDYKKANDQLFNTRARINDLKKAIKQAETAGIGLAQGVQVLGTDGQVLGGNAPVLPGLRFELEQLEDKAKRLDSRLKELRRAAAPPKPGKKPETPDLLPQDQKTGGGTSLNELLGGDIKRRLDAARAQLEITTAERLRAVAGKPGMDQAQRMIEFSSKYRDIQLQVQAIDETLTARAAVRNQLLSQAKDKTSAALAFDEQSRDLQNQKNILLGQYNKLAADQGKQAEIQRAAEAERTANALKSITDEIAYKQNILTLGEQEADLRRRINELVAQGVDPKVASEKAKAEAEVNKQLLERQFLLQQEQQLLNGIGSTFNSVITNLIQGTNDWTNSLQNALNSLANLFLQAGLQGLAGSDGKGFFSFLTGSLGKRANGGSVSAGQPYLVGERGPELFMPGRSGGIAPAGSFGGVGNVVVNVDAGGSSVQGDSSQANQLGKVIGLAVQQELIKQKRPGGLLA
jgi:tape measure domain-containing protein